MYFIGHRPRRVRRLSREAPNQRKRMLGLTPIIFFRVDVPHTRKQVFGDLQNMYICGRGERRQINKKSRCHLFLNATNKKETREREATNKKVGVISERPKKSFKEQVMEIIKKVISEQANKIVIKVMNKFLCRLKSIAPVLAVHIHRQSPQAPR